MALTGMNVTVKSGQVAFDAGDVRLAGGGPGASVLVGKDEWLLEYRPSGRAVRTVSTRQTPAGEAQDTSFRWDDPSGLGLTWTVSRLLHLPGFTLRAVFHNNTAQAVRLREIVLCHSAADDLRLIGSRAAWALGSLDYVPNMSLPAEASQEVRKQADFATLYKDAGHRGVLMGAVGPAEADVRIDVSFAPGGSGIKIVSEMTDVVVAPGECRPSEEVLVLALPQAQAAEVLYRWIGATHGVRMHRGPIVGWCSWYDMLTGITAQRVIDVAHAVQQRRDRIPMQVIQIDDGYQRAWGDWATNDKFPGGWAPVVQAIRDAGATPGIWMAPLGVHRHLGLYQQHPDWFQHDPNTSSVVGGEVGTRLDYLDPTHPGAQEFIRNAIRQAKAEGFEYFKIDFNIVNPVRFHDPTKTRLQALRDLYRLYRQEMGEGAYLNACIFGIRRAVVGIADAVRVAADSAANWPWILRSMGGTGGNAVANGILLAGDPDVIYTRPRTHASKPPGQLDETHRRTWQGMVGLLGGFTMISEPLHTPEYSTAASDRMIEILTPPCPEHGRSFTGDLTHGQFGFLARRPWGDFACVMLWNPAEDPAGVALDARDLSALCKAFHAWSFWDEKYHGVGGSFTAKRLPPHGAAMLRLTPAADDGRPVLVGSNLHISMGAAEIADWSAGPVGLRIALTDAGAREGKLYIHSRRPLSLLRAAGCKVEGVERGPRGLWTVSVSGRVRNAPQVIELSLAAAKARPALAAPALPDVGYTLELMAGPRVPGKGPAVPGWVRLTLVNRSTGPAEGTAELSATDPRVRIDPSRHAYSLAGGQEASFEAAVWCPENLRQMEVVAGPIQDDWQLGRCLRNRGLGRPKAMLRAAVHAMRVLRRVAPPASLADIDALVAGAEPLRICAAGGMLAQFRLAVAGASLIAHARIADRLPSPAEPAWQGSCVEFFGASDDGQAIGQIILQPAAKGQGARAWQSTVAGQQAADDIQVASVAAKGGYDLRAIIPLTRLRVETAAAGFLLELQVSAFIRAGAALIGTAFGSEQAFSDTSRYCVMRVE